jgi:ribosome-associated protein
VHAAKSTRAGGGTGGGPLSDEAQIRIGAQLTIPRAELTFRATRSAGPGGQHVNTSSTRVELLWDVAGSPSLEEAQRALLLDRLGRRVDSRGVLRLVEARSRSQHQNREAAVERFTALLEAALKPRRVRKKTRPPASLREERLREKKRRSEVKRGRSRPGPEE